jgi:hypothetical protein
MYTEEFTINISARNNAKAKRRRYWLNYVKLKCGCSICGYRNNPLALQFDHIGNKTRQVSHMITSSLVNLFKEVRKCRVLCANCHLIHTDRRRNGRTAKRVDT